MPKMVRTYSSWTPQPLRAGTDAAGRATVSGTLPFSRRVHDDGSVYRVLVVVVAPWWARAEVWRDAQVRRWVRWARRYERDARFVARGCGGEMSLDAAQIVERRWAGSRPPWPSAWGANEAAERPFARRRR